MSVSRFMNGGNSFGTKYVDSLFKKNLTFNVNPKYKDEDIERILNSLREKERLAQTKDIDSKRSFIDRGFDLLLTPNYVVAGAVDGMIRDDKSVLEGIIGGFKAGNPLGNGYEQGETTFSDVLESGGWKDDAFWGSNFLRGTAGLALDILLDPTTYMTFGISAALKGTGTTITKSAKVLEELATTYPEFAQGIRQAGALTDELAQEIVKSANNITSAKQIVDDIDKFAEVGSAAGKNGIMSRKQFAQEVEELKTTYNKLLGVGRSGKGITFGVQNMPFGDYVAKKLNITKQPVTLLKDSTIRKASDNLGVSMTYASVRDSLYGSKLGSLLSRNAGLKRLAEIDPAKLYEYVSSVSKLQGKDLDKLARERKIKEFGTKLLDLSPAEHKKIVEALEDKHMWTKIKETIAGSSTKAWDDLRSKYKQDASDIIRQSDELVEMRKQYAKASDDELVEYRKQLRVLKKQQKLTNVQKDMLDKIDSDIKTLITKRQEATTRPQPKDYTTQIAHLEEELKRTTVSYDDMITAYDELPDSIYSAMSHEERGAALTDMLKRIGESKMIREQVKMSKGSSKDMANANMQLQQSQSELRKALSSFLYGREEVLPVDLDAGKLEAFAHTIIRGEGEDGMDIYRALGGEFGGKSVYSKTWHQERFSKLYSESKTIDEFLRKVVKHDVLLSDPNIEVYKYLAKKYNYNRLEHVRDRLIELRDKLGVDQRTSLPTVKLDADTYPLYDEYQYLLQTLTRRNKEFMDIMSIKDVDERMAHVRKLQHEQLSEEVYEVLYRDIDDAALRDEVIATAGYRGREDTASPYAKGDNLKGGRSLQETEEIKHFRLHANKKPYSEQEVLSHSLDSIKSLILEKRYKGLLNRSLTPQAMQGYDEYRSLVGDLKSLISEYDHLKKMGASKELLRKKGSEVTALKSHVNGRKKELLEKTNLGSAMKQAKELDEEATKFVKTQLDAALFLHHNMFPHHKFADLTTHQKNMINGLSYGLAKNFIKQNGIPSGKDADKFREFLKKEGVTKIQDATRKTSVERAKMEQARNLEMIATIGAGVEVRNGDGISRGILRGITEEKKEVFREVAEKKLVQISPPMEGTFPKKEQKRNKKGEPIFDQNGKPIMVDTFEKRIIPAKNELQTVMSKVKLGEEGTGIFKYDIELPDGSMLKVDAKDVIGSYAEDLHVRTALIPRYTEEQIADAQQLAVDLKNKIRGLKGAQTKQEKSLAKNEHLQAIRMELIDKEIAELSARRAAEASKLTELHAVEKEAEETLAAINSNFESFIEKVEDYDDALKNLADRHAQIEKALDDNDLFEALIKLDMGNEGYDDFVKSSAELQETGELRLDLIADYDKHLVEIIKKIRHDFISAGMDEVQVGKLDEGAFKKMIDQYFPRTLSEDGKKFFDENPTLAQKYGKVTNEYGFGSEWTPHGKSRADETRFEGLTKINDFFESEHGVRIFEENVGRAYINRMLTSSEVVYDTRAMNHLMYTFGHDVPVTGEIKEGYRAVVNYGALREFVRNGAKALGKEDVARLMETKDTLTKEEFRNALSEIYERHAEDIVTRLGLDTKIMDGETVPLIDVTKEHIDKFYGMGGGSLVRQVNEMTIDRANQARQLTLERDEKAMLKLYDKFMTFFKLNQTTVMPAFHVRNHIGAMFVGWLGVGRDAVNIGKQRTAFQALKNFGKPVELRSMRPVVSEAGDKVYYWDEIMDLSTTYRVVDEGFMMKDFAAHSYSQGTRFIPGKFDPFNTSEFLPYKIGSKVATYSDNINRIVQFSSLLKMGKTPQEASDIVRKYMFDYSDLTTFEKRWMKRIFPYYTYMRKNLPMMANEFLDNPEKMRMVARMHNATQGMLTDDEKVDEAFLTGYAKDWVQMPFNLTGATGEEPVIANLNLPYMQLRDLPADGDLGDAARTFFSQTAPMIKVPIELATNWNSFFDSPIAYEDGSQISPRLLHVMSQLAAFNAAEQFVTAQTGDDRVLSLINTLTGVKMTTYDVETAKERVFEESYDNSFKYNVKDILGAGVRFADRFTGAVKANMSDMAISLAGTPYSAFNEDGALMPISITSYQELSDEEKQKYSLSSDEKLYFHNKALEKERELREEAGVFKRLAWMLVNEDEGYAEKAVVRVDKVTDGDTFVARQGDKTFNVRMLLVDTPESVGARKENPQPFGKDASNFTNELILGKDVKLYIDESTTYGRRLAFVEVGGQSVQEEILKEGLGKVRMYDEKYTEEAERLYTIEEDAYEQKKGVWSLDGYAVPRSKTGYQR